MRLKGPREISSALNIVEIVKSVVSLVKQLIFSRKGAKHAMICACVVSVAVFAPVPDIKSFMRGSGFSY